MGIFGLGAAFKITVYCCYHSTRSPEAGPVHDAVVPLDRLQEEVDALRGHARQPGQRLEDLGGEGAAVLGRVEGADGLDLQPDVGAPLVVRGLIRN